VQGYRSARHPFILTSPAFPAGVGRGIRPDRPRRGCRHPRPAGGPGRGALAGRGGPPGSAGAGRRRLLTTAQGSGRRPRPMI
jgi:hypothetical protein